MSLRRAPRAALPLFAIAFCGVLLLSAPLAHAGPKQESRALFKQGIALYEKGDHQGALARFQAAYAARPDRRILLNIGLTQEKLGDLIGAAESFEQFLADLPPGKYGRRKAVVVNKLDGLRGKLVRLTVACPREGATVEVDDARVGETPLPRPIYLMPGDRRLVVKKKGHKPHGEPLALTAGEVREVEVPLPELQLQPTPAPAPAPEAAAGQPAPLAAPDPRAGERREQDAMSTPIYKRWWFWTVVGVVVAGATTGGVLASQLGGDDRLPGGELGLIDLEK